MNGYTSANFDSTTPSSDAPFFSHELSKEDKINFDHQLRPWLIMLQVSTMASGVEGDN